MKHHGQSSLEFMILVGAVLFFFLALLFSINSALSDRTYERQSLTIQHVARTIQEEVAFAYATSDGYERTFVVPNAIINLNYTIDLVGSNVYLHTVDGHHALSVPIKNVTGFFRPGTNTLRKTQGRVYSNI